MSIKVLTIDDDPGMTALLKLFLRDERFEVSVANSGIEGIEAVRRLEPDVIVLDLMMPSMSGWEVCKKIRSFSQIPILVLTVITEKDQLQKVLDDGANDYISKPITKGELISHIITLAQQAPA